MGFLPGNIMTLIITIITVIVVSKITSFIFKILLTILLIGFLIYMFMNNGPETMQLAPAPMRIL